ncbi:MAG: hypothetical protein VX265_12550, partial [Myxococcota bacterium]|nr:hypothetical protein [Myxococcota bacterium]
VVRQLGVAVGNPAMGAAETSGLHGFDIQLVNSVAFLDADTGSDSNPAPWQRVQVDGDASRAMWLPGVGVRKGLPLGIELGGRFSYVGFSRQTVVGGYGRWGLVEGYREWPDIVVQVGYSGYVGNDELELGVVDFSGSIGYTVPFGRKAGLHEASFSPYVGGGMYVINARPMLSTTEQRTLGVRPVSGFRNSESYADGYTPAAIHVGYRILSGPFQIQMAGAWAPNALPMVNTAVGYAY